MTLVNASIHPVTATCPHCGNDRAELLPKTGDRSDYRCPICHEFSVSGTTERLFELGTANSKTAQIITSADGQRWLTI